MSTALVLLVHLLLRSSPMPSSHLVLRLLSCWAKLAVPMIVVMFNQDALRIVSIRAPFSHARTNRFIDGFDGADKVFLIEYMMPMDPGTHGGFESDMPAIWMLNAQIPRTTQYGPDTCNCWTSGCGE
jgi:hypothetical protein